MSGRLSLASVTVIGALLLCGPSEAQQTGGDPAAGPAPLGSAPAGPATAPPVSVAPQATPAAPPITAAPAVPPSVPPQPNPVAQTPAPAIPPATPSAPPEPGTPAVVLSLEDADAIIGKNVRSAAGDDMGRIIDVVVTGNGQPRAVVIDFGGFLGMGSRKVAVDWRVLQFAYDGKSARVTLSLTRNQVRLSPEFKPGEPIVVLGSPPRSDTASNAPAAPAAPAAPGAPASPPATSTPAPGTTPGSSP